MSRSVDINVPQTLWNSRFARNAGESAHPEFWCGLVMACAPGLGSTGVNATVPNIVNGSVNGTFQGTAPEFRKNDGRQSIFLPDTGGEWVLFNSAFGIDAYPFTLAGWGLGTVNPSILIDLGSSGAGDKNYGLGMVRGASRASLISVNGGLEETQGTTVTLNTGWHHVVGVWISDTLKILYVNGLQEGVQTASTTFSTQINRVGVGALADSTPSNNLTGNCDDCFVWNRALTSGEIYKLFTLGRGGIFQPKPIILGKQRAVAAAGMFQRFGSMRGGIGRHLYDDGLSGGMTG